MSRLSAWTTCGLCAVFATVVAAADPVMTSGADLAATRRVAREAEQKLLKSMHKKIKAEWIDASIEGILSGIAEDASVALWIDKQALSDQGINLDQQVTLNIGETTAWQALRLLLNSLNLTWEAPEGVLEITSQTKANTHLYTRTYDVSSMIRTLESPPSGQIGPRRHFRRRQLQGIPVVTVGAGRGAAPVMLNAAGNNGIAQQFALAQFAPMPMIDVQGPVGVVEMKAPVGDSTTGWKIGESGPKTESVLADLLKTSCQSEWKDVDGVGGGITIAPGRLVIRQSYQAHFQIQGLLSAVEHLLVRGVKAKSLEVRRPGYPTDEDVAIVERLTEPFTIDADNQPVKDILHSIATLSKVRIWVEQQSLAEQQTDIDESTTLKYTAMPLYAVLKYLLEPMNLTAVVEEGTVVVTTQADADRWQSIRIYNIGDITGISPDDLMAAVEACGEDEWEHLGGTGGAHFSLGSRLLVVRQSQTVHAEINNLLEDLRKNSDPRQTPVAPRMERRIYVVPDSTAINDLIRSLPDLVPNWDAKQGSIHRLGPTLAVNQTAIVHDHVSEIVRALAAADASLHPATPAPNVTVGGPMLPIPAAAVPAAPGFAPAMPADAVPPDPGNADAAPAQP